MSSTHTIGPETRAPHALHVESKALSDLDAPPWTERVVESSGWLRQADLVRLATLGAASASAAHDLGNLLQIIASGIRLIDRNLTQSTGADLKPICDGALAAVDRAAMLRLQMLEACTLNPSPSDIDLALSITRIGGLIALTTGPDIQIVTSFPKDVIRVRCEGQALENVILNLVVNARDAMPNGGRLTIETSLCGVWSDIGTASFGQPKAVLRVIDNGCGMSPEILANATKPFFTTKGIGRGTGLGLALVWDFAHRWGGTAEIDSILGQGTCVTLCLPACVD